MNSKVNGAFLPLGTKEQLQRMSFKSGESISAAVIREVRAGTLAKLSGIREKAPGNMDSDRVCVSLPYDVVKEIDAHVDLTNTNRSRVLGTLVCYIVATFDFDQVYERQPLVTRTCISVSRDVCEFIEKFAEDSFRSASSFCAVSFKAYQREEFSINWKSPAIYSGSGRSVNCYFRNTIAEEIRDLADEKGLSVTKLIRYLTVGYATHLMTKEEINEPNW